MEVWWRTHLKVLLSLLALADELVAREGLEGDVRDDAVCKENSGSMGVQLLQAGESAGQLWESARVHEEGNAQHNWQHVLAHIHQQHCTDVVPRSLHFCLVQHDRRVEHNAARTHLDNEFVLLLTRARVLAKEAELARLRAAPSSPQIRRDAPPRSAEIRRCPSP